MRTLLAALMVLSLVGCATAEELAAQREAEHHGICANYGFTRGTEAYGLCRMQVLRLEEERRANAIQAFSAIQQNRPRTTNCHSFGFTVNCTTY